jgi:hypothetical protein
MSTGQSKTNQTSPTTWLLSLALAATTTAAVIFAVLYFRSPSPDGRHGGHSQLSGSLCRRAKRGAVSDRPQNRRGRVPADRFKWKFTGPGTPDNHPIQWTAKGIRAAEVPKGP